MTLRSQAAVAKARYRKAREFYAMGKLWSRQLAWKILHEIANQVPGQYDKYRDAILVEAEEGEMYEAFRLLGTAARKAIEDMEYVSQRNYSGRF